MSDSVFLLTVHKTYYNSGFFNVPVAFDRCVRRSEGPVTLIVGDGHLRIDASVDRSANNNGTPRIMGGTPLRDWFQHNCGELDVVNVEFKSPDEVRITTKS